MTKERLKLRATGVGVLAYIAYGIILSFLQGTVLDSRGTTIGSLVILVGAILTARYWYMQQPRV